MAGEFETIDRLFAPLTGGRPGSFGLKNDAATLGLEPGEEAVLTLDTMTEGVHFLASDPPDLVARKLLRVNLSDLAAMGARPLGYLLSLARPKSLGESWLEDFAAGLKEDQETYGCLLFGGDSTSIEGPLSLSLTAIGRVPAGRALTRGGARPGEGLFVTGTIGDAALGLKVLTGGDLGGSEAETAFLAERYRLPQPRTQLGERLPGLASACLDVSDGLAADAGHIAAVSGVALEIEVEKVPLSAPARHALERDPSLLAALLTGGDDYELLFTAPLSERERIGACSRECGLPIVEIGRVLDAAPRVTLLDGEGAEVPLEKAGWTHY